MVNFRECKCSRQLDDVEGSPPSPAQLVMASKIENVLGHKYRVICLPAPTNRRRSSWPLESNTSFGLDKYKALPTSDTPDASNNDAPTRPNCYRLTGHELTVTGFAPFHSFDVSIYPNGTVEVVGDYPHRGPLGGLSKLIAFCEVGPHTEVRLVLIQETLDDAIAGGVISYVSIDDEGTIDTPNAVDKEGEIEERWTKDGGHNHQILTVKDEEAAKGGGSEIAITKKDEGKSWTKDGEHNHIILAQ